jgi:hypothetical protein
MVSPRNKEIDAALGTIRVVTGAVGNAQLLERITPKVRLLQVDMPKQSDIVVEFEVQLLPTLSVHFSYAYRLGHTVVSNDGCGGATEETCRKDDQQSTSTMFRPLQLSKSSIGGQEQKRFLSP